MKCLKGSLVAIVVLLLVGISEQCLLMRLLLMQITINTKYELTITSGQTVERCLIQYAATLVPKHHNLWLCS